MPAGVKCDELASVAITHRSTVNIKRFNLRTVFVKLKTVSLFPAPTSR